jgi:hypothetical protein
VLERRSGGRGARREGKRKPDRGGAPSGRHEEADDEFGEEEEKAARNDGFRGRGQEEEGYRHEKQGEENRPARSSLESRDLHIPGKYSGAREGVNAKPTLD